MRSNRSGRVIRMPRRYADFVPGDDMARDDEIMPEEDIHAENELIPFETDPDSMGLYRVYATRPTLLPRSPLNILCDTPMLQTETGEGPNNTLSRLHTGPPLPISITPENLYSAFSSPTAGLLMCWQYSSSNLISDAAMQRLTTFLDDDAYDRRDVRVFNPTREKKLIAQYLEDHSNPFSARNGWKESSVHIRLPKEQMKWPSEGDAPELEIKGVRHRSLIDIIKEVFEDGVATTFHMTPFSQMWKVSEERSIKVYSEAYASPAMMEAYIEVNSLPRQPDDNLERVVASLMMYSDSTHLSNFGDASLWPFYVFFGNESKYTRGKPTASACHHVAYIPTVSLLICLT